MNNTSMSNPVFLIIGKHGKTGARVEQRLKLLGYNTRGVSRSTQTAFDWLDSSSWAATLSGVSSAYVTFQPDLAVPSAEAIIQEFVLAAKEAGVQHLVLLSGRGEEGAERAERILQNSGLDWNVVRASWFAQNFSENFMLEGIENGELVLPAAETPEPFIDIDDLADVAVAALTQPELHNQLFEVTGPKAMTFSECVQIISDVTGREINYTQVPIEAYLESMKNQGVPEDYQWLINELFTVLFDGRNTPIAHGVEQVLGRAPKTFRDYVERTAESGIWHLPEVDLNASKSA